MIPIHRRRLLDVYRAGLLRVDGRRCVADALQQAALVPPVVAIAIGKASAAMMQGVLDVLGTQVIEAMTVTKSGYQRPLPGVHSLLAGHPHPDARSVEAGSALLSMLQRAPADASLLFLISGGASALVECPRPGIGLQDLQRVNRWLLGCGMGIHEVNQVRASLSLIKGGRLTRYLGGRRTLNWLLSDVPGDDPSVIGSGLLVPGLGDQRPEQARFPRWLVTLMAGATPPAAPSAAVETLILARPADARSAAAEEGRRLGYTVVEHTDLLVGDAETAGRQVVEVLLNCPPGLHVWSGETTVTLPQQPGVGGRCQHLALSAAAAMRGRGELCLLAAGTDGSDGPTEVAGALVDGDTVHRGERAGFQWYAALTSADAGSFLRASGDLVVTGPTGTNVMDLTLGLKLP